MKIVNYSKNYNNLLQETEDFNVKTFKVKY
jgi:hypothetical protein